MSVSGISSSSLNNTQNVQSSAQQFRQEFQQLGQDLQSGNLSGAQSDFAALQNLGAQTATTGATGLLGMACDPSSSAVGSLFAVE